MPSIPHFLPLPPPSLFALTVSSIHITSFPLPPRLPALLQNHNNHRIDNLGVGGGCGGVGIDGSLGGRRVEEGVVRETWEAVAVETQRLCKWGMEKGWTGCDTQWGRRVKNRNALTRSPPTTTTTTSPHCSQFLFHSLSLFWSVPRATSCGMFCLHLQFILDLQKESCLWPPPPINCATRLDKISFAALSTYVILFCCLKILFVSPVALWLSCQSFSQVQIFTFTLRRLYLTTSNF